MENVDEFNSVMFLRQDGTIDFFGNVEKAKEKYKVNSVQEIYSKLLKPSDQSVVNTQTAVNNDSANDDNQPPKTSIFSYCKQWFRQFSGYLLRDFYQYKSFWHWDRNKKLFSHDFFKITWNFIRNFVPSDFCFQQIFQPIMIAWFISLTCYAKYFGSIAPDSDDAGLFFFFCIISVFWLGMNNSIRELASERYPGRCLERLNKISLWVYIPEKLFWTSILSFLQTTIFVVFLFYLFAPDINKPLSNSQAVIVLYHSSIWSTLIILSMLYIMCILGAWMALAVSAWFKESVALSVMPLLLIPMLLFSYAVINGEKECKFALRVQQCSPCTVPLATMEKYNRANFLMKKNAETTQETIETNTDNKLSANENQDSVKRNCYDILDNPWVIQISWFVLSVVLIRYGQRRRELQWEGR